jgi:ubiquinol oxidase
MHLLTFLKIFPPGPFTRSFVFGTQFFFGAAFITLYVTSPRTAHRMVGYLEEMAVIT